jgi:tellurium resistance protein TerD
MTINLSKGATLDLQKHLSRVRIGLAWDASKLTGQAFDADASVAVLKGTANKKFVTDSHFVFYNNKATPEGAVKHSGDNRTGNAVGDDESVIIDLTLLPAETTEVAIIASIHDGAARKQDWSALNAVATLYDDTSGSVLATYNLGSDFAGKISVQPVSLYKGDTGQWVYKALGAGYDFGLQPFVEKWQN